MLEDATAADPLVTEMNSLQSAARWLVTASAAVAAVLLAGVQITALRTLAGQSSAVIGVAAAAGAVAVIAVGSIVVLAARVLGAPGWTLNKLSHLQLKAPENQWKPAWLRDALEAQRGVLVPGGDLDLSALYTQQHKLATANFKLHEHGEVQLPTDLTHPTGPSETYRADVPEHTARLQRRLDNVTAAAARVANAANLITARRRYQHLVRTLPWSGLLLTIGVITFVLTTTPSSPPVSTPLPVQIQFSKDRTAITEAGLPPHCAGLTLDAVAIGGSLAEPSVVSTSDAQCLLQQQAITPELGIVVPVETKK